MFSFVNPPKLTLSENECKLHFSPHGADGKRELIRPNGETVETIEWWQVVEPDESTHPQGDP